MLTNKVKEHLCEVPTIKKRKKRSHKFRVFWKLTWSLLKWVLSCLPILPHVGRLYNPTVVRDCFTIAILEESTRLPCLFPLTTLKCIKIYFFRNTLFSDSLGQNHFYFLLILKCSLSANLVQGWGRCPMLGKCEVVPQCKFFL